MLTGSNRSLVQRQRGQSLVEFALILPLMVLIVAGIFDIGRAFFASITITNAAREGARYGTLHPDDFSGMKLASVDEATGSGIPLTVSDITVTCPDIESPAGCDRDQPLRVTVAYVYKDMILGFLVPSGISMERKVEMLVP